MKVYSTTPTTEVADSAFVVRLPAVVESTIGCPLSLDAGLPCRGRPFIADPHRVLRQTDGLLYSRRFSAFRNPGPTETHIQLPVNQTFRTAVVAWANRWHHRASRRVFFLSRLLIPIPDIGFYRCEEEEHYS